MVPSLAIPVGYSVRGRSFTSQGVEVRELGGVLAPQPFFASSSLAAWSIMGLNNM
jgi:hypothetical protein